MCLSKPPFLQIFFDSLVTFNRHVIIPLCLADLKVFKEKFGYINLLSILENGFF